MSAVTQVRRSALLAALEHEADALREIVNDLRQHVDVAQADAQAGFERCARLQSEIEELERTREWLGHQRGKK